MFYLHLSNRTENLLAQLVEILRNEPRRNLFAKEYFLIQSQGMERMLSQRLADAFTVWCNFEYLLPTRFFDLMANRMNMVINPDAFARDALSWRIDALLQQITQQGQEKPSPLFAPLLRYMSGEQSGLKRYQLSQQLANIFDQYQIMRTEMLDGWQQQRLSSSNPAEEWQMALWAQLRKSLDNTPHRGEMLRRFLQRLQGPEDVAAILPARLSVFGLHSMPPLLLDCLHAVSCHCEVHLYLLTPCQNYWLDIPGKRQLIRENLCRLGENLEPIPFIPEIHPLLNSLGKQGQDFQAMLLDRIDNLIDSDSYEDPVQTKTPCLLHRLQSDLLDGGWKEREDNEKICLDSSLTIVSCHSAVREVMVLKDQILRWLQSNPEMELRDIVVMAPDIQEYAAIIPAIFHDIQHSIADRSLRHHNSSLAVFLQFLDLAVSRCSWSEVIDLLARPELMPAFSLTESDCELIQHWITSSGIRWGLSSKQLQSLDLVAPAPSLAPTTLDHPWSAPVQAEVTWQAGLDRLLMGYAMDWDMPVDRILPYPDIEGSQARPLGGLCQFIELLAQAAEVLARPRPLSAWSTLLLSYVDALFGQDMEDLAQLREILTTLDSRFGAFHHHDVPLEVIRAWLETTASESKSSAGFLRGQLTFCSMLPMRSIPFQAVCLLGLNDGVFPKTDRHPPFDLLGEKFIPGDRSKRGDDRYQFLEALLSARKYLYLSHVGQSNRSGNGIPPSVLITELIETLRLSYGIEDPMQTHPLQPFSPRYFQVPLHPSMERATLSHPWPASCLFSYNEHNCEVARALLHPPQTQNPEPWWSGSLPDDGTFTVNLVDLFRFFAHPQKWFVRNRLNIRLDTKSELPVNSELFSVSGLDRYLINQELVQRCLDGEIATDADAEATVLTRLKTQGRWMLGAPGQLAFDRMLPELSAFAVQIQAKNMGKQLPDLFIDLQIGEYRLVGQLADLHENGILLARYTECKGKDLLKAWIHHLLVAATAIHGSRCIRPSLAVAAAATSTSTHLLTKDLDLCFPPCADPFFHLGELMAIYRQGSFSPSHLLVEPAWTFIQQQDKLRARTPPLQAAITALANSLEQGYEPELALLYGDCDPDTLLGPEFQRLCQDFLGPIWAAGEKNP
ncbi:MAG: exodeoxyribonuclease V subunit gamma [Proteobacteria bacterium]|nr:exodeoxyribonuclease V subunit gamma [Desulfocapsa sp.]MBU3945190.1 exodeoxyribonuclease V subunit gamma [Pseudomonadota bacterium]MCG2742783.1 exodeoxyribonuclease V subunit gamma [Desulfobacteraceae bacterium]MBU3984278.1 exodeoxyribonuclease V subunit gamma [Pseudomonadota bacterium]MBU4027253.1 exodeoxyribonuclease V subunit gamma [Pseudomonadota bacterium]